jgi:hypothetical protein
MPSKESAQIILNLPFRDFGQRVFNTGAVFKRRLHVADGNGKIKVLAGCRRQRIDADDLAFGI